MTCSELSEDASGSAGEVGEGLEGLAARHEGIVGSFLCTWVIFSSPKATLI